jgi:hypothetical protein
MITAKLTPADKLTAAQRAALAEASRKARPSARQRAQFAKAAAAWRKHKQITREAAAS